MTYDLFVYGTLKSGYGNHNLCRGVMEVVVASTWGRLFSMGSIPVMEVPEVNYLSVGTNDYERDARQQGSCKSAMNIKPDGDWDLIAGEVIRFDLPNESLQDIDRLEGFFPGRFSFYTRVLIPVNIKEKHSYVWAYSGDSHSDMKRVYSWPSIGDYNGYR